MRDEQVSSDVRRDDQADRPSPDSPLSSRNAPGETAHRYLDTSHVGSAPRLPRLYLPRPGLWAQLDDGPVHGITLLIAPVGAGKTLGVSGWLRSKPEVSTAAWVHADASWSAQRLFDVIDSHRSAPIGAADGGTAGLVVVDDAHLLPHSTLSALDERLNTAPHTMRMVLLSRWDLPLSRLVPALLGNYVILRGDVLRLNRDECATLLAEHGRTTDTEIITAVTERTHGWCAAVVLAARAIHVAPDPVAAAHRFSRGSSSAVDQLASEVFTTLHAREQHLLLCVAGEDVVTVDTATHLSHDSGAGDLLNSLEDTGLLVTRLFDAPGSHDSRDLTPPAARFDAPLVSPRYRIHPLLVEVVRRRVAAGGIDVTQAQDTVRRAVRLDLARGDARGALSRLLALDQPDEVASVIAQHGPTLLVQGQGAAIAEFARRYPSEVQANTGVWFSIALERWFANDIVASAHWLDRCSDLHEQQQQSPRADDSDAELACAKLLRALLGSESLTEAETFARRVVEPRLQTTTLQPLLPLLLAELGMVQANLGELRQAERNLIASVALSRAHGLVSLTHSSLSWLALVLYMEGRERASREIANEVILGSTPPQPWHSRFASGRAQIVHDLAALSDVPSTSSRDLPAGAGALEPDVHAGDALTQFWARIRESRLALAAGAVVTAEQLLQVPATGPPLPERVRSIQLIERGFLASMCADDQTLRSVTAELSELGARGEAALLDGLTHELKGNRKGALDAFRQAAREVTYPQPATQALSLVCSAQLLDALGEPTEAIELLREAATLTEVRRNAVPFLGWSRQGTPVGDLLEQLQREARSDWIDELAALTRNSPNISTIFAPTTANLRERVHASAPVSSFALSARERDVLNELARGATYADIASTLFVSENTVKTHISSLYSKLGANRRSQALAAARNRRLL